MDQKHVHDPMMSLTSTPEDDVLDSKKIMTSLKDQHVKKGADLSEYIEDIANTVKQGLEQSISILTPWFFNNMPQIYYQTTPRPEKVRHLSAIITGHVFESKQTIELRDRDNKKVTYIGPGGRSDILLEMAEKLRGHPFKMGALYFSSDKLLFLSTFLNSDYVPLDLTNTLIKEKIVAAKQTLHKEFPSEIVEIDYYLNNLDNDFVVYATDSRLHITYRMYRQMLGREGAQTFVEPFADSHKVRLTLGIKHEQASDILSEVFQLMNRYGFQVNRAVVSRFTAGCDSPITVMHFTLAGENNEAIDVESIPMIKLTKALRTLAWVDTDDYNVFVRKPYLYSINAVNYLRALASWTHIALSKENPYYFSNYKILTTFQQYHDICSRIISLFRSKFDPQTAKNYDANVYLQDIETLKKNIKENILGDVERKIFMECLNFIAHATKTNYFIPTKTGLAFRLDPKVLNREFYNEIPFAFFFIVGRDFRFFQVRWRDISRGGLRVVMPKNSSDYDSAMASLFDEVYGLSYGQQLKNKDIPEGGSKAVLLLKPDGNRDKAVKGAVNALLDLLVAEDEAHEAAFAEQMSYYSKEEIIYLGPDENITNELINWIPEQAHRRGYKYAKAFMSSKPGEGINHKQYGVTSEGLNVFVDNVLKYMGIDPKVQKFTVKMTGGPDGDVAGNELKILHREYGEQARVVAIADGFGAAYDPAGLDWTELLRLVVGGHPINKFDAKKLSGDKAAFVINADSNENILRRNNLHFVAPADIFIPAGGRPYTVHDKNYVKFLGVDEDDQAGLGKPTCRAIVEGANIFFTNKAREELQKLGIIMIKDSSANKTGVICSSYEIIASLVLTTKEFLAIKEKYVSQVIVILRQKADFEAKLLLHEYKRLGESKNLVDLSFEISKEINAVKDSILNHLTERKETLLGSELCKKIIWRHCPQIIVDKYAERLIEKLPEAHKIAIVSSFIASYIVYHEGLGWLPTQKPDECYRKAMEYMRHDSLTEQLLTSIDKSAIKDKDVIRSILKRSAARDLTEFTFDNALDNTKKPEPE